MSDTRHLPRLTSIQSSDDEPKCREQCNSGERPRDVRTFCGTLAHTGCRISEALALTAARVDVGAGVLVFESLKKRRKGIYRAVPVPPGFWRAYQEF